MRPWRPVLGALLIASLAVAAGQGGRAQDLSGIRSPVLVVESERLYRESAFGQRVANEVAVRSAEIAAENRRIESELEAEELELTERRQSLAPDEFRDLADAFDKKVVEVRRAQEAKARAIARRQEENRAEFLAAAAPVLEDMMHEAGAAVVLERRSVFLSLNAIDITDEALNRIDEEVGDGSEIEDTPPPKD
jgi:Skp family chaperone for outer membrane proteins